MDAERRFTADAAHELRTPIAAIRTQAQVALAEADDDLRRHALEATLAGCDRATRLVEQLLTLSRLEEGAVTPTGRVDLSALARREVAEAAPRALESQQTIELDADEPCPVQGDATLLAVLVRNLVDNAVRYSMAGARVRVAVARHGGGVRLRVEDSGPGLSEADLARLGERFFRVIGSGQSGSGLGWSIVRRIAAAHKAKVDVGRSSELGGLAVTVDWLN
jgi:two-component system sensor histidine kinase QseC